MDMKAFSIRLPDDIAEQLQGIADAECRSLNQQVEYALRLYLAAYSEHPPLRIKLDRSSTGRTDALPPNAST